MTKIKICGLVRECDIDYANEALPDFVGFVFAPSRRRVSPEWAREQAARLDKRTKTVGVFVGEGDDLGFLDYVQVYGDSGVTVVSADGSEEFPLFDSAEPGSGETFDWSELPRGGKPFFLAGGINLGNIEQALSLSPYCVDISSGAESDGVKDREKILALVRAVREFENEKGRKSC